MAVELFDLVQARSSPNTLAKLRRLSKGVANAAIDKFRGRNLLDAHLHFILTRQSLQALVDLSRTSEARNIHSISFAALLIDATSTLPVEHQQDHDDFQTRIRDQEDFIRSDHPLKLITEAFLNLAQHGNNIRLLYSIAIKVVNLLLTAVNNSRFPLASLDIDALEQLSYPLNPFPPIGSIAYFVHYDEEVLSMEPPVLHCDLWNRVHQLYYRVPVRFRVYKPSQWTCSEISVVPILRSHGLRLAMRSLVSEAYTNILEPGYDFRQLSPEIHAAFPFHHVLSLLVEDCPVTTRTAPGNFRHFREHSVSLTLSGVKLLVEGQNDYGTLVDVLRFLQRWRMLAHVKFERITILYCDKEESGDDESDEEESDDNWLETPLQFEKNKHEWNSATEVRLGLDDLIYRFGNNVDP